MVPPEAVEEGMRGLEEVEGVEVVGGVLGTRTLSMPLIHDYFDPNEGPVWEDDCEDIDNYMAKLYRNGEVYKPVDFGHIVSKPCQLFTNKMHLRDVVRDNCIQPGFSIMVNKDSNWVYIVRCNDERFSWRLHGLKLPDGVTWTITSIT
ncbi:ADP-ribosylation factor 6 [Bienertia sinuspersici]